MNTPSTMHAIVLESPRQPLMYKTLQVSQTAIHTETKMYPLSRANNALSDLRNGTFQGAAVLVMDHTSSEN